MIWLWLTGLGLIGLLFVTWPMLSGSRRQGAAARLSPTRADTSRALYHQRLAELQNEHQLGLLSDAAHAEAVTELGLTLLADQPQDAVTGKPLEAAHESSEPDPKSELSRWWITGFILLFSVGAAFLYVRLGEPDAAALRAAGQVLVRQDVPPAELSAWQQSLERRLASRPGDTQSWYLLGHVQLQGQRYAEAADAFAQASASMPPEARGTDLNLDLYWLQARFLAARGALDTKSHEIVQRILAKAPNHPFILEILAMEAFRTEDFEQAISVLNRALAGRLNTAQRASLQVGLQQARERLQAQGKGGVGVNVTIQGLAAAPHQGTLFVIARPIGGGMPFAVVRRPGPDFPADVRLDDAVSMNPANPLSAAKSFEVVVRLSQSGGVQAQPEDWQWISPPLNPGAQDVALVAQLAPPTGG